MQKAISTKKVGEIELFRFIFSICIMLCHQAKYLTNGKVEPFAGGFLAVEFFFIVSGYLMMSSIHKRMSAPSQDLGGEAFGFIWKKITSVYPEFIISFVLAFITFGYARSYALPKMVSVLGENVFTLFLLPFTGLGKNSINGAVWYIQSMLLCMCILYPLIRKFPKMMSKVIMPLSALCILGWLYQTYGQLSSPTLWIGITFKGNLRAFAEICIGAIAFNISNNLKKLPLRNWVRWSLTAIKWLCWVATLIYMFKVRQTFDFLICLLFAVAITLSFSGQCIDVNLYQNRFVFWLGKISLPIYLNHFYFARDLALILPKDMSDLTKSLIFFAITAITSVLVMMLSKWIRALVPSAKRLFLK